MVSNGLLRTVKGVWGMSLVEVGIASKSVLMGERSESALSGFMNENGFYNLGLMTCVLISCCLSGKRGPYNLLRWLLWWSRVSGVRSEYQPVVVCKRCPEDMMSSLAQEHGHLAHAHLGTLHLRIEPLLVSQTFGASCPVQCQSRSFRGT